MYLFLSWSQYKLILSIMSFIFLQEKGIILMKISVDVTPSSPVKTAENDSVMWGGAWYVIGIFAYSAQIWMQCSSSSGQGRKKQRDQYFAFWLLGTWSCNGSEEGD